jgi:hypothetical protein
MAESGQSIEALHAGIGAASASAETDVAQFNSFSLQLRQLNLHTLTEEADWHEEPSSDLRQNPSSARQQVTAILDQTRQVFPDAASVTSSKMALSIASGHSHGSRTSSNRWSRRTPSFASEDSSLLSESSAQTPTSEDGLGQVHGLEQGEDGILLAPVAPGALRCSFWFLSCSKTFDNFEVWEEHNRTHFGHGKPPKKATCPFDCAWTYTAESGDQAWEYRRRHIIRAHQGFGVVDTETPPDSALFAHLWRNKAIDHAELQELRTHGKLTDNNVFTRSEGLNARRRYRKGSHPDTGRRG